MFPWGVSLRLRLRIPSDVGVSGLRIRVVIGIEVMGSYRGLGLRVQGLGFRAVFGIEVLGGYRGLGVQGGFRAV